MIYNSRDKKYKSLYGATPSKSDITFRLLLPSNMGTEAISAHMIIRSDSEGIVKTIPFRKSEFSDALTISDSQSYYWELVYTTEQPDLYWYCFEYTEATGNTKRIYRGQYATGYTDIPESWWQLTVYEEAYSMSSKWYGGIMYQIYPDRFNNSGIPKSNIPSDRKLVPWGSSPSWRPDKNGNVKNNDYTCGDLKGIEEKLPYLKSLGVDIIYLNPIFEAHSNNRYNTADYEKIDPLLGSEEDFISLCNESHKLGIKIILDGVFSHTGDDSKYFNKYNRYPTLGAFNSKESKYYNWYKFNNWPNDYTSWWGIPVLPEVIEETPDYCNYITGEGGIVEKWLRLGADGWRIDVADELPDHFIEKIRERINAVKPGAILIGEVWEDASTKEAYGVRRKYLFGKELSSVMNYPFRNAIINYLVYDNAEGFIDNILTITENYPKGTVDRLMNMLGTHDTVRILTRLSGEDCEGKDREYQEIFSLTEAQRKECLELVKIAAVLQYTLPGFPSVYYGDEIGMEGCKDPFNRCCFPWKDDIESNQLLKFYRELGQLRVSHQILKDAEFVPISGAQGCIAYARKKGNKHLIVITNRAQSEITYTLPEEYCNSKVIFGDSILEGTRIKIKGTGYAILENI